MHNHTKQLFSILILPPLLLMGCKSSPNVRQYTAPKEVQESYSPAKKMGYRWITPTGWQELPSSGMRLLSFATPPAQASGLVTLTSLPPSGFNLLANVNRWERQLSIPESTAEALSKVATQIKNGDKTLTKVTLKNNQTGFIIYIEYHDETFFFTKLSGPINTINQQEVDLFNFVLSLRHTHE